MAARHQVTCITKNNSTSAYDRITHIGGSGWKITVSDAISYIQNGTYEFYVSRNGYTADVIVATRNGVKYLKTKNDGDTPDNLLSLPQCP